MSDVATWIAAHFPNASPWQIRVLEAMITAHKEGRNLDIRLFARGGWEDLV